jgi:hypothetical protein
MNLTPHLARRLRLGLAGLFLLSGGVAGAVAPWLPTVALPLLGTRLPLGIPAAAIALLWVLVGAACLALPTEPAFSFHRHRRPSMHRIQHALSSLAALLVLAACAPGAGPEHAPATAPSPSAPAGARHFPSYEDLTVMLRYLVEDGETPGIVLGILEEDGSTRALA